MQTKKYLIWQDVKTLAGALFKKIGQDFGFNRKLIVYGIPRGGINVAQLLTECSLLISLTTVAEKADLFVDDLVDSGSTRDHYKKLYPDKPFYTLYEKKDDEWVVFPWEVGEEAGPEENIKRLLEYIGENPNREGLLETPKRVLKSYDRLFGGYRKNAKDLMKVFEEGACNEMVVLKNIRFYSTCEHHMLPFFGVAHVAYIPNGKVVGVSKLARLVDMFARRMQIQERIGTQVVDTLMELLNAKGAACVIEAQHMCMTSRGVENQTAKMVTSALRGVFMDNAQTRAEFLQMIKGE